ncbi:minor tail protein [Mycobacterium phage Chaser]|nr:minor tail protein [Mycobacterium phage Chaser]
MTMPNGSGGLDPGAWLSHWVNQADLSSLAGRTEDEVRAYFENLVQADSGWGDASNTFFNLILGGFQNLSEFVTLIVQAVTGAPGGLTDLQAFLTERWGDLADAFQAVANLIDAIAGEVGSSLADAIAKLATFLTELSPLNAGMLFGLIGTNHLPLLSVSHIANINPELLVNAGFDSDVSVVDNPYWDWDGTVGRTAPLGSVKVVADGTIKDLLSGPDAIPVVEGQKLNVSAWFKYAGLVAGVGSGAIRLSGTAYSADGEVVAYPDFGGVPDGTTGTGDWAQITGQYVVPAGVTQFRLRLSVRDNATAGTVWFDDCSVKKAGLLPQGLVDGLTQALNDLLTWLESLVDNVLAALGLDPIGTIVDKILDLADEFGDWLGSTEDTAAHLTNLLSNLLTNPASVIGPLAQSMITGLTGALGNLNTAINQIGDVLVGTVVTPINSAISNVIDWFNSLLNFQDTTAANQVNQQNFQIATLASGIKKQQWECRYSTAFVTFPEMFCDWGFALGGVTGAQSTGTAHTHTLNTDGLAALQLSILPAGYAVGGYIGISDTTIVDTLAMKMYKETSSAINNVYLEVFREDPTGALTVVGSVDVSGQLTTTSDYVEAALPAGVIVNAGERYVVRMRNASTVGNRVGISVMKELVGGRELSIRTETAADSNKTTYTPSEVLAAQGLSVIMPWAMMAAKNLATTDQSFSDDFNRSAMGGLWFLKSDTGTNQVGVSGGRAAFSGLTDGNQNALYIRPTAGDKQWVEANLYETGIAASGAREGLLMHANRDLSQVVYLGVNLNSAKIYTGPWNSLTERASVSTTGNDVLWQMYFDPATAAYTVLKNGQASGLTWTDSGSVVAHGPNYRFGGLRISRSTFFNAGRVDNWTLKDWT